MNASVNFRKFRLIMWKNLLLVSRNKRSEFWTIVMPIFFVGVMILLRFSLHNSYAESPAINYPPVEIHHPPMDANFPVHQLAYYPLNYSVKMEELQVRLGLDTAVGFNSSEQLVEFFNAEENVLGVLLELDQPTNTLNITIKLRFIQTIWDLRLDGLEILNYDEPDGHSPYIEYGFAFVQQAIFETLFGNPKNISILLNRFPVQAFINDPFLLLVQSIGSTFVVMSFYNVYLFNLKHIIQEKESQLKEMLLIMGLPNWVDWLAWFTKIMLENIPISIVMVLLLKLPIAVVPCLPKTDFFLLWVVIAIYVVSLSTFSMMITTFFKNSKRSNLVGGLLFLASIVPILYGLDDPSTAMSIFGLILTPSAFGYAFRSIILFEQFGVGMQWQYVTATVPTDVGFPISYYLISMSAMNGVHILVMLYVEQIYPGEFGTPRSWYFPIEGLFKKRVDYDQASIRPLTVAGNIPCEQPRTENAVPAIQITQLTKRYGDFYAINNLTLNMDENEIVVLLGENGAGKSTTMAMLTGVIPATAGTAVIYQMDIRTEMKEIRQKIGLCPQRNVLFNQLTVLEHLLLFSKLKGLKHAEAYDEASGLMERLELKGQQNELSYTLSGGMKRKLNLAISLAGRTKAVFLDEPTSGVDPASRRDIWNVLQEEKQNRMILLSTHFMDEADVLGDRVAILHHGELKCQGSAFYLKNLYRSAYKLTCAFRDGGTIEPILDVIRRYVPVATLRDNYGLEYHFDLNPSYLSAFGELFRRLEASDAVASFGIELPNLEDVFIKIQKEDVNADGETASPSNVANQLTYQPLTGPALWLNWFLATLKKRMYYNFRNIFTYLLQILLPTLMLALSIIGETNPVPNQEERMILSLASYDYNRVTPFEANVGSDPEVVGAFKALVKPYGGAIETPSLDEYILEMGITEYACFKTGAVAGVHFARNNTILAMFNNQAYHSVPIALTLVYNAIIKGSRQPHPLLLFINEPYAEPVDFEDDFTQANTTNTIFSVILAMALIFEAALMGTFYVADRFSGALNIQFISGMSPPVYWTFSFLLDLIPFNVSILAVVGVYWAAELGEPESLWQLYLIMFLFGVAILPFVYLRSRRFSHGASLFTNVLITGTLSILVYFGTMALKLSMDLLDFSAVVHNILLVVPFYNILDSIVKFVDNSIDKLREDKEDLTENYLYFMGSGALFMFLLIMHDMNLMNWLYGWMYKSLKQPLGVLEDDVQAEMARVDAMRPEDIRTRLLVAKHLAQSYKKKPAVRDVTFVVDRGECLGLLGKNGAGKTTTFKMLTGEVPIREGEAWLNGISIKRSLLKTYSYFGYCPQVDGILEDLTGLQSMEVIALVRGIPYGRIAPITKALASELGFDKHMKKQASKMSGGNRRKLCSALALIGQPPLVYMDEPTTGMDPSGKRQLWNVMAKRRQGGNAVILTTHSMEECEALCTRLAILAEGKLEAIATPYNLKQKYAKTGQLVIQLERGRGKDKANLADLKNFLERQLRDLNLRQEHQGKLEFEFNRAQNLSTVFTLMESIKTKYGIESYAVSNQNSLDNVFMDFVTHN